MVELCVRLIKLEADLLQHALRICAEDRVLPALHHDLVELTRVGEVEISHHHERACGPGGPAHVGVQSTFAEVAAGAVAQVADVNLSRHLKFALDGVWVFLKGNELLTLLVTLVLALLVDAAGDAFELLALVIEDLTDVVHAVRAAHAEHVGQAWRHAELAAANAEAVLAAVTLFGQQGL